MAYWELPLFTLFLCDAVSHVMLATGELPRTVINRWVMKKQITLIEFFFIILYIYIIFYR